MSERVPRSIGERRLLVDTSAFLALADRKDRYHGLASRLLQHLGQGRYRLLTTRDVVVESHATILSAVGGDTGRTFLLSVRRGVTDVIAAEPVDLDRAEEIVFRHRDKAYSLCDAISFAVMERLGLMRAFAFDDHFRQYGFLTPLVGEPWP